MRISGGDTLSGFSVSLGDCSLKPSLRPLPSEVLEVLPLGDCRGSNKDDKIKRLERGLESQDVAVDLGEGGKPVFQAWAAWPQAL